MGTNAAPVLANLFLYRDESRFIDGLVERGDTDMAARFHLSFRLIDDTLSIDNPHWIESVAHNSTDGGIYHSALTINNTTPDHGESVQFIGMSIGITRPRFTLSVFDKRNSFPFPVRRYPHMSSLIPPSQPYGVFVGQLHRGYRICTNVDDFASFSVEIGLRCLSNGCAGQRLMTLFRTFCTIHMTKYSIKLIQLCIRFNRGLLVR
jgi:hypothetical protein